MGSLVNALRRIQHGAPLPNCAASHDANPSPPETEVQVTERLEEVEDLLRSALAGTLPSCPEEVFQPNASPSYARQLIQIDPDGNIDCPWQADEISSEWSRSGHTTDLWQPENLTPGPSGGHTTEPWQPEDLAPIASDGHTTDPWQPENLTPYDAEPMPEPPDMASSDRDASASAVEADASASAVKLADVESSPHSGGSESTSLEARVEEALAYAAKITEENKHLALDLLTPAYDDHHEIEASVERASEPPEDWPQPGNDQGVNCHPIDAMTEPPASGAISALVESDSWWNTELPAAASAPGSAPAESAFAHRIQSQWDSPRLVQAYQRLAETVQQDVAHRPAASIVLLGCGDEPDVTDVAASLAEVLANHHGARVLLVDANVTGQTLSRQLQVDGKTGLAEVCGGVATWEHCLQASHLESVFVLPAGGRIDRKRIRTEVLAALVPGWKDAFQFVLVDVGNFDSPLALPFLERCDVSYFVACLGRTLREQAAQAVHSLAAKERSPAGCIVTNCLLP